MFPNEVFGIVGESGSGKSMTMLAVMGLLPNPVRMTSGEVILRGRRITGLSFEEMRKVRGKSMSMIFQDPMTSLNPVLRVGSQIAEAVRLHNPSLSQAQIRARIVELLSLVGIPDPERRFDQYPNEFSGGMRQRAMIAIAMANDPDLLIADEPTTALDVTIQAQVLDVLARIRARTGAAMVLITHDLGLVAESADRVAVMYGGRMMERAGVGATFAEPRHPYTVGLISSLPRLDRSVATLYSIPGQVPNLAKRPSGCVFHPRCGLSNGRAGLPRADSCISRDRAASSGGLPLSPRRPCSGRVRSHLDRAAADRASTPRSDTGVPRARGCWAPKGFPHPPPQGLGSRYVERGA